MIHNCKDCGRNLDHLKTKRYLCSTCKWKRNYFKGLYWKVIERDKKICRKCGIDNITMNVDHINDNPEDNRLDNLQVLCVNCHTKKRLFYCKDCKQPNRATAPRQVRCMKCGLKHESLMNKKRLARYYQRKGSNYYNQYLSL